MKKPVYIPEVMFAGAERLAQWTKRSRSDIYAAALREYVARHSSDAVTEAMNAVVDEAGAIGAAPLLSLSAWSTLERVDW